MYSYDRRIRQASESLGTFGVSLEQVTSAVRHALNLPHEPNIMFGAVSAGERELSISFEAAAAGRIVPGRVVFRLLESNSRMWSGTAILLEGAVEV